MIKTLRTTTKYYATQEAECKQLIEKIKTESTGDIIKQQVDRKEHKDYGGYYEVLIVEEFTTSRNVLEGGF